MLKLSKFFGAVSVLVRQGSAKVCQDVRLQGLNVGTMCRDYTETGGSVICGRIGHRPSDCIKKMLKDSIEVHSMRFREVQGLKKQENVGTNVGTMPKIEIKEKSLSS